MCVTIIHPVFGPISSLEDAAPDRRDQNRRRFGVSVQCRRESGTGCNQPEVETVPSSPLEPKRPQSHYAFLSSFSVVGKNAWTPWGRGGLAVFDRLGASDGMPWQGPALA